LIPIQTMETLSKKIEVCVMEHLTAENEVNTAKLLLEMTKAARSLTIIIGNIFAELKKDGESKCPDNYYLNARLSATENECKRINESMDALLIMQESLNTEGP
jgi:hypothetical protein